MKRIIFGIASALLVIATGCAGLNKPAEVKLTPLQILQPTIDMINYCSKDTGLNTMAYKAYFDTSSVSLVVYLGKSETNNEYMWEIPLQYIDKSSMSLFRQDYNVSTITFNTYGAHKVIKYFMMNKLKSKSNQFVLYLGKCFGSNDKDMTLDVLIRAITAAQENIDMTKIKKGPQNTDLPKTDSTQKQLSEPIPSSALPQER